VSHGRPKLRAFLINVLISETKDEEDADGTMHFHYTEKSEELSEYFDDIRLQREQAFPGHEVFTIFRIEGEEGVIIRMAASDCKRGNKRFI
jgi:hypothetical protein